MGESDLDSRVLSEIDRIPLVDSHEHLISERARLRQKIDFFNWFAHYSSTDLLAAGMKPEILEKLRNPEIALEERFADFAPFWKHTRNTGYAQILLRAANDLFDVPDINESTWLELSERITASNVEGWYQEVLKKKGNFEVCILQELKWRAEEFKEDIPRKAEPDLFAPVAMFDRFVMISSKKPSVLPGGSIYPPGLDLIAEQMDIEIYSFEHLLEALDLAFEREVAAGAVGVKCALAYHRPLRFELPTKGEAERVFNAVLSQYEGHAARPPTPAQSWDDLRPFQDYIMHRIFQRAIDHNLPLQFHTGLQEGIRNILSFSNPTHLTNLFIQYPGAKFIVFHAGYPYARESALLAKTFPNVYIDLCWIWSLGFKVAKGILDEWIELVPENKILGFGGDYIFVEGAYAASRFAREGVAEILTSRIMEKHFKETEAIAFASKILRENAKRVYQLT